MSLPCICCGTAGHSVVVSASCLLSSHCIPVVVVVVSSAAAVGADYCPAAAAVAAWFGLAALLLLLLLLLVVAARASCLVQLPCPVGEWHPVAPSAMWLGASMIRIGIEIESVLVSTLSSDSKFDRR